MSSPVVVAILGLLGLSMALPVEESLPYNPQDFYPMSYVMDGSVAPEDPSLRVADDTESLQYNPQDFYPSPPILESSNALDGSRIVGGTEAPEGSAPYMVALMMGDMITSFLCGGSLVSPCHVLTAAHCIDPLLSWIDGQLIATARGQVGSNSLSGGFSVVRFSRHENHPEWNPWLIKNDVGLLVLDEKLKWSKQVQPIAINYDWVDGEEHVRVTGWGRLSDDVIVVDPRQAGSDYATAWGVLPDWLQELVVVVLSPSECEALVREANALLGPSPPVDPRVELCTRHLRGAGHGMCNGDSGSAVTLAPSDAPSRRAELTVAALVSWGWACALGHPDVHARLSGVAAWLRPALHRPCACDHRPH